MEAYIKYKGVNTDCYVRFGKQIPVIEMKIDICKYFGCDEKREKFIISQLSSDKKISCKIQKTAGDTARKEQIEIEAKALNKEKLDKEIKEKFEKINIEAKRTIKK